MVLDQSTVKAGGTVMGQSTVKAGSTVIDRSTVRAGSTVMGQSTVKAGSTVMGQLTPRRQMQPSMPPTRQADAVTSSNQNPLEVDTVAQMTNPRMDTAPNEVFVEERGMQTLPIHIQDDNSTPRKTVYGRS